MRALLLVLTLAAPVALKRTPKVDDKAAYAMRALIDLGGQDDVRFTGTYSERIKSIDGDRITTAVTTKVSVELMGVVRESRAIDSERVELTDGTLVTPSAVDGTVLFATPRIDRLRAFYPPVEPIEPGIGWWRNEPRSEAFKAPPFSVFEKIAGEEKIGSHEAWKVALDANEVDDEHPVRVKGMLWIDKKDGSLVQGQWTIDGFTYSDTAAPSNARLELTRTD